MIENLSISSLTLLEKNPRKITRDQMEKLRESLKEDPDFLDKRPILVNKVDDKYLVYAGNQRVRAAKSLGWKQIPCIVDVALTDEVMRSRTIKDNKTFGDFDYDILANDYELPDLINWGFTPNQLSVCTENLLGDDEEKDKSNKKPKVCPHCGEDL